MMRRAFVNVPAPLANAWFIAKNTTTGDVYKSTDLADVLMIIAHSYESSLIANWSIHIAM